MIHKRMQKQWNAHPDYPGYLFSREGDCLSIKRTNHRLLKKNLKHNGYHQVALTVNGVTKHLLLHRLIGQVYIPCKNYKRLQINHKDGVKTNNHVSNLEWVTPSKNSFHRGSVLGWLPSCGEDSTSSKLTEDDIAGIFKLLKRGALHRDIAKHYGVIRETISSIANRKTWKHLESDYKNNRYKNSKLTKEQVIDIKIALKTKNYPGLVKDLAKKYGVRHSQISRIKSGDRWKGLSIP